jgi:hypothetical protein
VKRNLFILVGCLASAIAADRPGIDQVKASALHNSHSFSYLEELSNGIGPRLTGSPQAAQATSWAQAKMKSIGLKNVHLETWQLPRGWRRGIAQAQLIAPFELPLNIASYGWAGSTRPGGSEAEVLGVDSEAPAENTSAWAGKILLVRMRDSSRLAAFASTAAAAHAVAVIRRDTRPGVMLTHTEPLLFPLSAVSGVSTIAVVDIAEEHQKLLESHLKSGRPVRMRIDVENLSPPGPVDCANIVGEIPGYEHPAEVVIVSAHLDSWDLGTGATDDGFGAAAVLAAAEAILGSDARPRRTIRFILFTGEEQGLLGSRAYVQRHHAELGQIVCAFALDWGQGPITKFLTAGHEELTASLQRLTEAIDDVQKVQVTKGYLNFTDAYSFTLAGVPGVAPFQDSPGYGLNAHSAADTLDKVDAVVLARDSAVLALAAFWVADDPVRAGDVMTPEETALTLIRDKQRALLELLGLWPF